ncbi:MULTISPECIES: GNAT family N-acetyltransferase [Hyphobacterium]|uniref:GNAT family N-acetyltransferase n=1 Tax=Hyphobacterium vulgare TaxID=1736751 RepID=A0ABV6ZVV5_9PROT
MTERHFEIRTKRLKLVALNASLSRLQIEDRAAFFDALHVRHEAVWPPELMDGETLDWLNDRLSADPRQAGWLTWVFIWPGVAGQPDRLVGAGGFKGAPDDKGCVEVGYSMLLSFREQGLATEAVEGLLEWAESDPRVKRIIAHTLPHLTASQRVLEKTGFVETESFEDASEGETVVRYERPRRAAAA